MRPVPEQLTRPSQIHVKERRGRLRYQPSAVTYVILGKSHGGIITNISETGMCVTTGDPLREELLPQVSFRIPQSDHPIQTRAEVVWTSESKKEAGVRFVKLGEESREHIGRWISQGPRNGDRIERPAGDPGSGVNRSAMRPSLVAGNSAIARPAESFGGRENNEVPPVGFAGHGQKHWALTEAQRVEFERLFPSEKAGSSAGEIAAPETAAPEIEALVESLDEPPAADAPSSVPPVADTQWAVPAATIEHGQAAAPEAGLGPGIELEEADAAAAPRATTPTAHVQPSRMRLQPPWDTPQRAMEPIIGRDFGRNFGRSFGTTLAAPPPTESANAGRSRSMWTVLALVIFVVAACFALGFAVGPNVVREWPKVKQAPRIIVDELSHFEVEKKNAGSTNASAASGQTPDPGAAVNSNTAPSNQIAAPAPPAVSAPVATEPAAKNAAPDEDASSTRATAGDSDETPDATTAAPAPTGHALARSVKEHRLEPFATESRASAQATPAEKPQPSPNLSAGATPAAGAPNEAAQPPGPMRTPEPATPANTASAVVAVPGTPPAHAAESAAHSASLPPSYFPVVAPAAGNVPRLIELPEERIIDTAGVVIHSHQIVFVPAEPGPESSHPLEKLQVGNRITKLAPTYPVQAAQKGMGGTVHLRATIGKDGKVQDVRPLNGPILLITSAEDAIRQWQYGPTLLDQQPIEMQEDFTIEFRPLGVQIRQ